MNAGKSDIDKVTFVEQPVAAAERNTLKVRRLSAETEIRLKKPLFALPLPFTPALFAISLTRRIASIAQKLKSHCI